MTKLVISNETFWNTSKHCDKEDEKSNSKRTTLLCHFYTLRSFYGRSTRDTKVILLSLSICRTKINNMCKISKLFRFL